MFTGSLLENGSSELNSPFTFPIHMADYCFISILRGNLAKIIILSYGVAYAWRMTPSYFSSTAMKTKQENRSSAFFNNQSDTKDPNLAEARISYTKMCIRIAVRQFLPFWAHIVVIGHAHTIPKMHCWILIDMPHKLENRSIAG